MKFFESSVTVRTLELYKIIESCNLDSWPSNTKVAKPWQTTYKNGNLIQNSSKWYIWASSLKLKAIIINSTLFARKWRMFKSTHVCFNINSEYVYDWYVDSCHDYLGQSPFVVYRSLALDVQLSREILCRVLWNQ